MSSCTNEVRFSQSGRPMFYVTPELNAMVNRARDNYIAGLMQQTAAVLHIEVTAETFQMSSHGSEKT